MERVNASDLKIGDIIRVIYIWGDEKINDIIAKVVCNLLSTHIRIKIIRIIKNDTGRLKYFEGDVSTIFYGDKIYKLNDKEFIMEML